MGRIVKSLIFLALVAASPVGASDAGAKGSGRIRAPTDARSSQTTYRIKQTHCEPCRLEDVLTKTVPSTALDCGHGIDDASNEAVRTCADAAHASKKAFVARFNVAGIDSELIDAYIRLKSGTLVHLRFHSDTGGGLNFCRAAVFESRCEDFIFTSSEPLRRCIEAPETQLRRRCWEAKSIRHSLSTAKPTSRLRCKRDGSEWECTERGAEATADDRAALPNLICEPMRGIDLMFCSAGPS